MKITRSQLPLLIQRLTDPRRHLVVLAGPRQVGKTTLVRQALAELPPPHRYVSADDALPPDVAWLRQQWQLARSDANVLVIDEVQRVPGWSDAVKALWDEDTRTDRSLRVVLLGSAPLLLGRGLGDGLAGRYEVLRLPHWSFSEMREAFGVSVDEYVCYGGYPGAAHLIEDPLRWSDYVRDALIEATVSRDVLQLERVERPALLRRLFDLGCAYAGQERSLTKILGQLQDSGNTATPAWYLELLGAAGLLTGLQKFAGQTVRMRAASPKLMVCNTALRSAVLRQRLPDLRQDPEAWGRQVEVAVGAHLLNTAPAAGAEVSWWRERNAEVDFVVTCGQQVLGIEVKSGRRRANPSGLRAFQAACPRARGMVVGQGGVEIEEFLERPTAAWLGVFQA